MLQIILILLLIIVLSLLLLFINNKKEGGSYEKLNDQDDILYKKLDGNFEGLYFCAIRARDFNHPIFKFIKLVRDNNIKLPNQDLAMLCKSTAVTLMNGYDTFSKLDNSHVFLLTSKICDFKSHIEHPRSGEDINLNSPIKTFYEHIKIIVGAGNKMGEPFFTPLGIFKNPFAILECKYKNLAVKLLQSASEFMKHTNPTCKFLITRPVQLMSNLLLNAFGHRPGIHLYLRRSLEAYKLTTSNDYELKYKFVQNYLESHFDRALRAHKNQYNEAKRRLDEYDYTDEDINEAGIQDYCQKYIEKVGDFYKVTKPLQLENETSDIVDSVIRSYKESISTREDASILNASINYPSLLDGNDYSVTIYNTDGSVCVTYEKSKDPILYFMVYKIAPGISTVIEIDKFLEIPL